MDIEATTAEEVVPGNCSSGTKRDLLQDLNGEE